MPFVISVRIHELPDNAEKESEGDDAMELVQEGVDASKHDSSPSRADIEMSGNGVDDELEYCSMDEDDTTPYINPHPEATSSGIHDQPTREQPSVPKSMDNAKNLDYEILKSTFDYIIRFNRNGGNGKLFRQSPRLTLQQELEALAGDSGSNPGDLDCPVFRNSDHRQMTLTFMALDAMHKYEEPTYVPRLADDLETLFYVSLWRGLGARAGDKVNPRMDTRLRLPREFKSYTIDTVKNAKRRLFLDTRYGRPIVKNIMFMHPIAMHLAVAWYEVMRCSYSGKILNATRRAKYQEEGEAIPAGLLEEESEDVPPGAMMYYTGAQSTNLVCNAPCCRTHWARWAKKINLNKNLDGLWESG